MSDVIAEVALKEHENGIRSWIVQSCPYCGARHRHGAGRVGTDPNQTLGYRAPHCRTSRVLKLPPDQEIPNGKRSDYLLQWDGETREHGDGYKSDIIDNTAMHLASGLCGSLYTQIGMLRQPIDDTIDKACLEADLCYMFRTLLTDPDFMEELKRCMDCE